MVMDAMALRRGAKSKIGEARFGKCPLTITPPEFIKGVHERRIFRRKKKWWERTHRTPYLRLRTRGVLPMGNREGSEDDGNEGNKESKGVEGDEGEGDKGNDGNFPERGGRRWTQQSTRY